MRAAATVCPRPQLLPLYLCGQAVGHICMPIDTNIQPPLDDLSPASSWACLFSVSTISGIRKGHRLYEWFGVEGVRLALVQRSQKIKKNDQQSKPTQMLFATNPLGCFHSRSCYNALWGTSLQKWCSLLENVVMFWRFHNMLTPFKFAGLQVRELIQKCIKPCERGLDSNPFQTYFKYLWENDDCKKA